MYERELAFAKNIALEAGKMMLKFSTADLNIENKADNSPVTEADIAINKLVLNSVKHDFPKHGVIGEEDSNFDGQKYVWVCDPIDGTIAYIRNFPTFMFSLALVNDGVPVVAAAYNPKTNELFHAVKGGGAFLGKDKISVSGRSFDNATIGVSGALSDSNIAIAQKISSRIPKTAHLNAAIGAVFLATKVAKGDLEGYIFHHDGPHDMAASKLIIDEAGGMCTDLQGNEQRYDQAINGAVASNGKLHNEILSLV